MQQDPWTASSADDGLERRFGGVTRLLGAHAHARLRAARIGVVGVGGVGSWAAEALARSGVERITLIDLDHVAESNANRQIQALDHEFGKAKVVAMAQRIEAINPDEPVRRPQPPAEGSGSMVRSGLACAGFGSSVVVTAPFGFAAAARAMDRIIGA